MLFNSVEFLVFLLLVLVVHYLCIPARFWGARKTFLVVASFVFYMSWNPVFGLLLLTSTLVDYTLGRAITAAHTVDRRRWYVLVSVAVNVGILGFFKYGNFFVESVVALLRPVVPGIEAPALDITLPVGISFYTFESLSYTIDVFRGVPACRNVRDFALFLSFFPHLVAGPIVRPQMFLEQLGATPRVRGPQVEAALARIATGLVKKVVFADVLGAYVDQVYGAPARFGAPNVLLAMYAYAFQIYFDFSGYTDMALGVAQLFGLRLPENFQRPYLAANPREFWSRWHISLSTWLRDYLYIPLGGNRSSTRRTYANLMITMLLGGLWHGAAWHFVAWGGFHGAWLAVHRAMTGGRQVTAAGWRLALRRIGTFHLVCVAWVLFRAPSLADVGTVLGGLRRGAGFVPTLEAQQAVGLVALAGLLHVNGAAAAMRERWVRLPAAAQGMAYGVVALLLFVLAPATERFIYFQF